MPNPPGSTTEPGSGTFSRSVAKTSTIWYSRARNQVTTATQGTSPTALPPKQDFHLGGAKLASDLQIADFSQRAPNFGTPQAHLQGGGVGLPTAPCPATLVM